MASDDIYGLTGSDLQRLSRLLREYEGVRLKQTEPQRRQPPPARIATYLGVTTTTITARSGSTLGSGTVEIYSAADGALADAGFAETAYNPCGSAIASGGVVQLFREPLSGALIAVPLCGAPGSGSGGGGPVECPCCPDGAQESYCVSFPGVADAGCDECSDYAGTITLTHTGAGSCTWLANVATCSDGVHQNFVYLFCDGSNWFVVVQNDRYSTSMASYGPVAIADWDCDSAKTFARNTPAGSGVDPAGACQNWPASVVVQPCSGGGGSGITITGAGKGSSGGSLVNSLDVTGVPLEAGLVVVVVSMAGGSSSAVVTVDGAPLTGGVGKVLPSPHDGLVKFYRGVCGTNPAAAVNVTLGGAATAALQVEIVNVAGLASNAPDTAASANGLASTPDTGATATTAVADEAVISAFLMVDAGGSWTWGLGLTSVGQDVSDTVSGTPADTTAAGEALSATGTARGQLAGVTPVAWAGIIQTFS